MEERRISVCGQGWQPLLVLARQDGVLGWDEATSGVQGNRQDRDSAIDGARDEVLSARQRIWLGLNWVVADSANLGRSERRDQRDAERKKGLEGRHRGCANE